MLRRLGVVAAIAAAVLMVPTVALAQSSTSDEGVLIRVNGDAILGEGERVGFALVVRGNLVVMGSAQTVVVVDGTATLEGATVETVVVVRGDVVLGDGTVVTGDVWLENSTLSQSGSAQVAGAVRHNLESGLLAGFWIVGIILGIGLGVLAILSGLTFAAVAPETARRAGDAIRHRFGQVVIAGLIFWLLVPAVGGLLLLTVVGIPAALAIWLVLMPVVGFLGYLVAGIWIGELIVAREGSVGHPYLAAFLGVLILVVTAIIPGLGAVVATVASLLGGSALALLAWRSFRASRAPDQEATETEAATDEATT